MNNKYLNKTKLKLLLLKIANMYNNLNISTSIDKIETTIESLLDRVTVLESYDHTTINNTKIDNIGDIVLYNTIENLYIYVDVNTYTSSYTNSTYTPIGVIVVSADMTPDNVTRIMALKYGSCESPDTGSIDGSLIYWGSSGLLGTEYSKLNVVDTDGNYTGTDKRAYFPRYEQTTSSWNVLSPAGMYWYSSASCYGPDPVTSDWELQNPLFYADGMATNDFEGEYNTLLMLAAATGQEDWKTADTIDNEIGSNLYPAASVCWRYSTAGTSQGDWYLPAAGELIFMGIFKERLDTALNAIIDVDSSLAATTISSTYNSSSEISSASIWYFALSTNYLNFRGKAYSSNSSYVRPFCKLS